MSFKITLPVIGLPNVVFFSETVLPMTIQDKTCIQIVRDAIQNGSMIALSKSKDSDNDLSYRPSARPSLVCTAGIPHIVEDNVEENYIRIVLKGESRVYLKNCLQELPYPIFQADYYPIQSAETVFDGNEINYLRELMTSWLETFIQDSQEREQFLRHLNSIHRLVNNVSMLLVKDPNVKQILLENNSLPERIKLLNKLFKLQKNFQENQIVANAMKSFDGLESRNLMPN